MPKDSLVSLHARAMAHEKWSRVEDRSAATKPGRDAADARFEREVDPDGTLPPAERARRVESARRAHFTRLAMKSVEARRAKKAAGQ